MMVTILLGEQGAMFTQRPSFDLFLPKEACKFTQRPSFDLYRLDNAMDGYTQAHAERQREKHYYTTYGTAGCVISKEPVGRQYSVLLAYGRFTGRRSLTMSGLSVA